MTPDENLFPPSENSRRSASDDWIEFASKNGLFKAAGIQAESFRELSSLIPDFSGPSFPAAQMKQLLKALKKSPESCVAILDHIAQTTNLNQPYALSNAASAVVLLSLVSKEQRQLVLESLYARSHEGRKADFWQAALLLALAFRGTDKAGILGKGAIPVAVRKALHVPYETDLSVERVLLARGCGLALKSAGLDVEMPHEGTSYCRLFASLLGRIASTNEGFCSGILGEARRYFERGRVLWKDDHKAELLFRLYSELVEQGLETREKVFSSIMQGLHSSSPAGAIMAGRILRGVCEASPQCKRPLYDRLQEAVEYAQDKQLEKAVAAFAAFSCGFRDLAREACSYLLHEIGESGRERAESLMHGVLYIAESEDSVVLSPYRVRLIDRLLEVAGGLQDNDPEKRRIVMEAVEAIVPAVRRKSAASLAEICLHRASSLHPDDQDTISGLLYAVAYNFTKEVVIGIKKRLAARDCEEDEAFIIADFVTSLVTPSPKSEYELFLTQSMRSSLIESFELKQEGSSFLVKSAIDAALSQLYFRTMLVMPREREEENP